MTAAFCYVYYSGSVADYYFNNFKHLIMAGTSIKGFYKGAVFIFRKKIILDISLVWLSHKCLWIFQKSNRCGAKENRRKRIVFNLVCLLLLSKRIALL